MKRIINGKAYNTDTALFVATTEYRYDKGNTEMLCVDNLYRTSKGAFFHVETNYPDCDLDSYDSFSQFTPLTYDEAHLMVMGKGAWDNMNVDLREENLFPSIKEAGEDVA